MLNYRNDIKSTVTSKGQITLPKTIRDVMNLKTGNQITFEIQSNDAVIMRKSEPNKKLEVIMNLVSLLQEKNLPLIIKGGAGLGKTTFAKNLLISQFTNRKVAVIDPESERYEKLNDYIEDITTFVTNDLNTIISELNSSHYDIIVIEEARVFDINSIKTLLQKEEKLILIAQVFHDTELLELGSHFSITIGTDEISIDQYNLVENEFIIKRIYELK